MPRGAFAPAATGNLRGILWMLVFTLCMSSMHGAIRHVSAGLHPFEIAFFRILFGVIVVLPWFVRQGFGPLRTERFGMMALRGLLNAVAMLAFFFALAITPLADVTALMFTAPIFATVLAMVVFGETVGPRRWAAIGAGFAGTLVVLRPGFHEIGLGPMLVVFSSVAWGVCMIIIKSLGRTDSSVTITAYMSLVMTPLVLVPALLVWQWPTGEQVLWLVGIGMLGGAGQLAMAE
ncbi:MAG: DMT family transporter, partial [Rhodospirillales bacterium]